MPIHADPDRLQQCLAALVENAIAYPSGAIQLFVTAEPEQIVLHVQDQGPGILIRRKQGAGTLHPRQHRHGHPRQWLGLSLCSS